MPAIAMLGHNLRPHTPWVPIAPAFALSSETLQDPSNKEREWSITRAEVKAPLSPRFRVPRGQDSNPIDSSVWETELFT